jgi:hypothetical protein
MARIGARKHGKFKAVSTAPTFNKTPVGSSTPPLPYPVTHDLDNSVGVVPTVRLNNRPAYVLSQTTQPSCKGDAPGSCKGVKSGTVSGEVKPVKGSSTVRVGKNPIIRQGDPCTLNGGNCPGVYVTSEKPSALPVKPATKPETPAEKSFLDSAADALKQAGQWYKDNASEALHDFAGNAMDTGGTISAAGGGTAAVGGAMVATGVGAAPGAVIAVGGGAVAAVGGGVAGVGGIAESAATALDGAASFATSGQLPNMTAMATAYAQRMVMSKIDKLTKLIPGKKGKDKSGDKKKPEQADGGNDGFKVVGSGGEGRCKLRPYDEIKDECAKKGMDAHHVVPNRSFQTSTRKANKMMPGGVPESGGLAICLESNKNGLEAEHTKAHKLYDAAEKTLAKDPSSPEGLALLGQVEDQAAAAVEKATNGQCNKENLKEQLREHHQKNYKLKPDTKVRATKNPNQMSQDAKSRMGGRGHRR